MQNIEDNDINITLDDNDENTVIAYLSNDIILENIREQIETLENRTDFISTFESRFEYVYQYIRNNVEISTENINFYLNDLDNTRENFFDSVLNLIKERFSFNIAFSEGILNEEKYKMIIAIYRFFIVDIESKIKDFYINTLLSEKETLIKQYDEEINKNDMIYNIILSDLKNTSEPNENTTLVLLSELAYKDFEFECIEELIEEIVKVDEDEEVNDTIKDIFVEPVSSIEYVSCNLEEFTTTVIKETIEKNPNLLMEIKSELINKLNDSEE